MMSRSSEEVLLIINHVKHKKTEGSLYLMGERLAWMPAGKDSFTISHLYADIRVQKISPDGKEKVQLQIVMHNDSANTFHFCNPKGRPAQLKDREGAKELLQQLLPKFRKKINSELEEKNRMLQEDPELFQLYKDLVVSQVISADEFWANRVNKQQPVNKVNQSVGVSAAFLSDVKPQTDGCNGLKYNLTADIIESIFRTYPAVKLKHAEYVPDKMTESEFWTKFFQSHYFHRDRIHTSSKDLFSECAKKDEADIAEEIHTTVNDPLLDLTKISDKTFDEGFGNQEPSSKGSTNPSNTSMIRRFNHHSTMVLRACDKTQSTTQSASSASLSNGTGSKESATMNGEHSSDEPALKKARIREKIELDDLQSNTDSQTSALTLAKMERYLHGPTPVTATQYNTSEDILQADSSVKDEMIMWSPRLTQVLPASSAVSILGELSPGGALMPGTSQHKLHQMVSAEIQLELKQLYNALCELLRHFWACFPATTPALEEKVVRMKANLERFQVAKLRMFKDKLSSHHYSVNLTGHIEEMLTAAYKKFNNWQQRRMNKK